MGLLGAPFLFNNGGYMLSDLIDKATDFVNEFITSIDVESLAQNEIFVGFFLLSLMGTLMYILKGVPMKIWNYFLRFHTVELTIHNNQEVFDWFDEWLSRQNFMNKSRRLQVSNELEYRKRGDGGNSSGSVWTIKPGQGYHILFYRGKILWINHEISDDSKFKDFPAKYIIRTFGRNQKVIRQLIAEMESLKNDRNDLEVRIFSEFGFKRVSKVPRPLDSVVLNENKKNRIVEDMDWFRNNKDWYSKIGIPYRRGYMFSGPPGTGKTSLVMALASHFEMKIYYINLSSIASDSKLNDAFSDVPKDAILLIEDIDAVTASNSRENKEEDKENNDTEVEFNLDQGLSLSGLLNNIDGVAAEDGRIMIMTTNHPENLDPALVRSGRVDIHEHIGYPGYQEVYDMFLRFFPGEEKYARQFAESYDGDLSPADLQNLFLENIGQPSNALKDMEENKCQVA